MSRKIVQEYEDLNETSEKKGFKKLNRQAKVVTIFFSLIFLFMIGFYVKFMVMDSKDILSNSFNKRINYNENSITRGGIYSAGGDALAYTDESGSRVYPFGETFSHVVGIRTHEKYGLEKSCNNYLLSTYNNAYEDIIADFSGDKPKGCNVYTTLDTSLQQKAFNVLGDYRGAVFVMDPQSGKILASVSKPAYDPNTVDSIWDQLVEDSSDSRLVNRATQGKYIPGSIFKIVTTLEYIKEHKDYSQYSYDCFGKADFNGFSIACFNGNSHGHENLTEAFASSCNSAFSKIGTQLDMKSFKKTAEGLLFNKKLPLSMDYSKSSFALDENSSEFDIAQTSIGQGETTVSPAHMAMIAAAIENGGVLMEPYIVDHIDTANGSSAYKGKQKEYGKLMNADESKALEEMMSAVCDYGGTGRIFSDSFYEAYGKTGTAELDKNDNINSWFVGYGRSGDKKMAIGVVLENINQNNDSAVTLAKEIMDSYFE